MANTVEELVTTLLRQCSMSTKDIIKHFHHYGHNHSAGTIQYRLSRMRRSQKIYLSCIQDGKLIKLDRAAGRPPTVGEWKWRIYGDEHLEEDGWNGQAWETYDGHGETDSAESPDAVSERVDNAGTTGVDSN